MSEKPNCYQCAHRRSIPGDAHSRCTNISALVVGNNAGIARGWFKWPFNFDPTWLVSCSGFQEKGKPSNAV